jgi:hypothetical protein
MSRFKSLRLALALLAGGLALAGCGPSSAQSAAEAPRPAPAETAKPAEPAKPGAGLALKDFAGSWTGETAYQTMQVRLDIAEDGKVLGGTMGSHPFQKRGEVTITDPAKADGFKITFYFSDVCQDKVKTVEKATFTRDEKGAHRIEGHFSNPCFPPSSGAIKLGRKLAAAGSAPEKKEPEPPKPLPAATAETVQKVKALMNRLDSKVDEEREAAWKDLTDMGDLATPALVGALKTGSPAERRNAARALGLLKDKAAAEALRAALADKDVDVRWHAARALGEIGDGASKEALAKLLKDDPDETVREHSAYALASLGADEGLNWFKEELAAKQASRRSRAVKALGKYGKGKFIAELAATLKDPEARVRTETVIQLGELRQKEAIPPLITALGDEDYHIRERARSALERLTFVDDLGSDQAKWQAWWAKNGEAFKVSATGKPEPHKWANATTLKGEDDYQKHVADAKGYVVVDFHVPADRDCIRAARALDRLAADYKGKLVVCEAEAQANAAVIRRLKLQIPPTVIVYKDGKRLETIAGSKTEEEYRKVFDEHLAGTRKFEAEKEEPIQAAALYLDLKDEADFKARVEDAKGLVLVDFHTGP